MNDFESISEELSSLDETGLSKVSKLAQMQVQLQRRVADIEEELKTAQRDLRQVSEDQLPAAMAEYNITKLELEDGSSLVVNKFYNASIPKDEVKAQEAFEWLVDNGHGDLIKNEGLVRFVRGQEDKAEEFANKLTEEGMAVSTKKKVEPMTLKGFVREQTELGTPIPTETFNIFIGERSKVTPKTKRG